MPVHPVTAGENILASRFVKLSSSENQVLKCGDNERVWGISHESNQHGWQPVGDPEPVAAAYQGESLTVYGEGSTPRIVCGGSFNCGDLLKSDTNGAAVKIATSGATPQNVGAIALEDGVSGNLARVEVFRRPQYYVALS